MEVPRHRKKKQKIEYGFYSVVAPHHKFESRNFITEEDISKKGFRGSNMTYRIREAYPARSVVVVLICA